MSGAMMTDRRRAVRASKTEYEVSPRRAGLEGPPVAELAAGAAPTAEQMGSRVDLPGEIREKMESSFGADFSNVRLFESQTVADAGAQAVTQGNNIAFAPGKLDLASTAGQALLGHELSHVVSQSRGESAGRGFLNDAHLEAQADRQGMMAARGESVYSGPVSPIGASSAASAAGPMQAKKNEEPQEEMDEEEILRPKMPLMDVRRIDSSDALKTVSTWEQLKKDAAKEDRKKDYLNTAAKLRARRARGDFGATPEKNDYEMKAFKRSVGNLGRSPVMKEQNGKRVVDTDSEIALMRALFDDMAQGRATMLGEARTRSRTGRAPEVPGAPGNGPPAPSSRPAAGSSGGPTAGSSGETESKSAVGDTEKKRRHRHTSGDGTHEHSGRKKHHKKSGQTMEMPPAEETEQKTEPETEQEIKQEIDEESETGSDLDVMPGEKKTEPKAEQAAPKLTRQEKKAQKKQEKLDQKRQKEWQEREKRWQEKEAREELSKKLAGSSLEDAFAVTNARGKALDAEKERLGLKYSDSITGNEALESYLSSALTFREGGGKLGEVFAQGKQDPEKMAKYIRQDMKRLNTMNHKTLYSQDDVTAMQAHSDMFKYKRLGESINGVIEYARKSGQTELMNFLKPNRRTFQKFQRKQGRFEAAMTNADRLRDAKDRYYKAGDENERRRQEQYLDSLRNKRAEDLKTAKKNGFDYG